MGTLDIMVLIISAALWDLLLHLVFWQGWHIDRWQLEILFQLWRLCL
jgi:hypothetical protein